MRDYLTTMREQAYIDIKPGYADTGASAKQSQADLHAPIRRPSPRRKKKVERTRFRESTHTFRQKIGASCRHPRPTRLQRSPAKASKKNKTATDQASMKPGKKEKIRYGKAPRKTLPKAPQPRPKMQALVNR